MSKYSYSTHHPLRYGGAPKTPISIASIHREAAAGAVTGAVTGAMGGAAVCGIPCAGTGAVSGALIGAASVYTTDLTKSVFGVKK